MHVCAHVCFCVCARVCVVVHSLTRFSTRKVQTDASHFSLSEADFQVDRLLRMSVCVCAFLFDVARGPPVHRKGAVIDKLLY